MTLESREREQFSDKAKLNAVGVRRALTVTDNCKVPLSATVSDSLGWRTIVKLLRNRRNHNVLNAQSDKI